jgi:hypothetical protein
MPLYFRCRKPLLGLYLFGHRGAALRRSGAITLYFLAIALASGVSTAAPARPTHLTEEAPQAIVLGFMGGHVAPDDATRNELIISNRLRASYPHGVYFEVWENRRVEDAHQKILRLLRDKNSKSHARIILYGHSWGASAVVTLASELKQDGIPVQLTPTKKRHPTAALTRGTNACSSRPTSPSSATRSFGPALKI